MTPAQEHREAFVKRLRSRGEGYGIFAIDMRQAANEIEALAEDKERAVFIAEHLMQMIPREVWRESGAIGPEGQYEGDYHEAETWAELQGLK